MRTEAVTLLDSQSRAAMNPNAVRSSTPLAPAGLGISVSRHWLPAAPVIAFIGLNPSTADEINDDPTVRRCIGFARRWGFGGMYMLNVFGYRSTNPQGIQALQSHRASKRCCFRTTCRRCNMVVACWGVWGRSRS